MVLSELMDLDLIAPPQLLPRLRHFIALALRQSGRILEALDWLNKVLQQAQPGDDPWLDA